MAALTDLTIRNAKPGEKVRKISDGGGLQLWVMPNGSKLWRLAYRYEGKQKVAALGRYPLVGLGQAREKSETLRAALRTGHDPATLDEEKTDTRATFGAIADEVLAKMAREHRADATITKTKWLLDFTRPDLGEKPIADITAGKILEVLRKVEERGRYETARRLRATIGSVFRYAIATDRAETDPTIALHRALTAPKVKHRAAIVEPKAFGQLLLAIRGYEGQPTVRIALELMALLFPRPGELRLAHWEEFDLEAGIWTIPASRAKMRREHRKPLPPKAIALLNEVRRFSRGDLVFGSTTHATRPISENTLNAALRRMGYGADDASSHGFRATASTLLNQSRKWSPDAIERELGHVEADEIRRAYHRAEYWDERVTMMQWWSDEIDRLRLAAERN